MNNEYFVKIISVRREINRIDINIGPCSTCIVTLEPFIVFVLQLPGTMCSDNLLLKALENQAFIMMILLFLCGIKMFLGISTILYLFYPNIKSFLRRTKDILEYKHTWLASFEIKG